MPLASLSSLPTVSPEVMESNKRRSHSLSAATFTMSSKHSEQVMSNPVFCLLSVSFVCYVYNDNMNDWITG